MRSESKILNNQEITCQQKRKENEMDGNGQKATQRTCALRKTEKLVKEWETFIIFSYYKEGGN